ncbi:MAG: hypothetical protein Q8R28_13095 [Dehalococcoidia bacterium]|nr:hypothetical protein [Dehalococcoidia bacterium]
MDPNLSVAGLGVGAAGAVVGAGAGGLVGAAAGAVVGAAAGAVVAAATGAFVGVAVGVADGAQAVSASVNPKASRNIISVLIIVVPSF